MPEQLRRHGSDRFANRADDHLRYRDVERPLHHERRGAGGDRVDREVVSVRDRPGDAEEEAAGRDRAGVVRAVAHEGLRIAPDVRADHDGRHVGEAHQGEGHVHRSRAYTPHRGAQGAGSACGGSPTASLGSMPSRWIAYLATCWNSGAAATPP